MQPTIPQPSSDRVARRRARQAEWARKNRAANPEAVRERGRQSVARFKHGHNVEAVFAAMWASQGGKCYLCGIYLVPWAALIEHDHRCCPGNRTCTLCRRGLACPKCNFLIAIADDDPDTLRLIADNLEAARAKVTARLAARSPDVLIGSLSHEPLPITDVTA